MASTTKIFDPIILGVMRWGQKGANLDTAQIADMIAHLVKDGFRWFDHADIYGGYTTEADFGKGFQQSGVSREEVSFITKCGICSPSDHGPSYALKYYDTTAKYIRQQVQRSIANLQSDYLDTLLIHRPDPLMNYEELAAIFSDLKAEGLVRSFGVSNFTPIQFETLHSFFPLVTNQVEASVVHLHPILDGTFDLCQKHGIHPQIWSPLAGGALFGDEPSNVELKNTISTLSKKYDQSEANIMLRFLLDHPSEPSIVLGSANMDRIKDMSRARDFSLERPDWFKIWTASTGSRVP